METFYLALGVFVGFIFGIVSSSWYNRSKEALIEAAREWIRDSVKESNNGHTCGKKSHLRYGGTDD